MFLERQAGSETQVGTGDQNGQSLLFKEHFLGIFLNEGSGSVHLSLIRKQSLPEEALGTGEVPKEIQRKSQGTRSLLVQIP